MQKLSLTGRDFSNILIERLKDLLKKILDIKYMVYVLVHILEIKTLDSKYFKSRYKREFKYTKLISGFVFEGK